MKSMFGENEEFEEKDNQCFVIMPFSEPWSDLVYSNVKRAVMGLGMNCIRGDDAHGKIIVKDIWEKINESRIIITDVSKKNSNVFYELGMAHTLDKDVIIISQSEEDVPFDIRHFRRVIYENNLKGYKKLKNELTNFIKSILSDDLMDNFGEKINEKDYVVLYVSSGGTCRCAMANSITRYHLKNEGESDDNNRYKIRSLSVALMGATYDYASPNAQEVIKNRLNFSINDHKTLEATFELFDRANLILTMDSRMYGFIKHTERFKPFASKTYLFTEYFGGSGDISDPLVVPEEEKHRAYERCFEQLLNLISIDTLK